MSYTIPNGIQTKADAVLAVASVIADEDKSALGDGSVNTALDVLADTLAGSNVEVPQTNAGAILALADYVSGGGGAQSYPITFEEETGGTVYFYPVNEDGDAGEAVTEAAAGTPLMVSPVTSGGQVPTSGSVSIAAYGGNVILLNIDDFNYEHTIVMPIGGLTVNVTVRE